MHHQKISRFVSAAIIAMFLYGCQKASEIPSAGIQVEPFADYQADADCVGKIKAIRQETAPTQPLYERYRDLRVIDIHNHGVSVNAWNPIKRQEQYFIDRTVLFGNISEPAAVDTDHNAYVIYSRHPDQVYPFFAGIPLREEKGITMAVTNLEKGYLGIGEIVAASTYSPVTSQLPWKAEHPNDGILPELYQLSARYGVPVLLHIDPLGGEPIEKLEQALQTNPQAILIFGHANAFNTPANIEGLVSRYPNLYIDFFAGFTAYNPESTNELADYVPLIEKYPGQFMVSTDSGYGIGQDKALAAIYELLDLLTPEAACQVSHQNMERIIESQLPTETQIAQIEALSREMGRQGTQRLNKRMANELIFELTGE